MIEEIVIHEEKFRLILSWFLVTDTESEDEIEPEEEDDSTDEDDD